MQYRLGGEATKSAMQSKSKLHKSPYVPHHHALHEVLPCGRPELPRVCATAENLSATTFPHARRTSCSTARKTCIPRRKDQQAAASLPTISALRQCGHHPTGL